MSIQIIKQGMADTLQDHGRYGFQHLGIPPCGYLDYLSAQLANTLVGNPMDAPLFELHFPSSVFTFNEDHVICISGANFVPILNEKSIEMNTPIAVKKMDTLRFMKPLFGQTAYLSIKGNINSEPWLNSQSYFSTIIQTNAIFPVLAWDNNNSKKYKPINTSPTSDKIDQIQKHLFNSNEIRFIPGPQWNDLTNPSSLRIIHEPFYTGLHSNRMGYSLHGPSLQLNEPKSYLSSAVTRGTLQLLPNGNMIVLMANHQTIGGYANVGQIILVDLPKLVQHKSDIPLHFSLTNISTAHLEFKKMQQWFS